jgi:site-specific recombinase XerC
VLAWLSSQYGVKKPKTIMTCVDSLTAFFRFCLEDGHVERVLVKKRWRPRLPKPIPKYLDKGEQARVKLKAERLSIRDRAIYEFLLSSGCRCSELTGLDLKGLDIANRTAMVLGKGRKIRQVHFSETCAILLQKYLATHPQDRDALFLNQYGNRLSKQWIYMITSGLGRKGRPRRQARPPPLSAHLCH